MLWGRAAPRSSLGLCSTSSPSFLYPDRDLQAQSFAFEDGSVPPFPLIMDFCTHAQEWLSASKAEGGTDNVIAVHCKAGLGRTGLMISCLLLYLKVPPADSPIQAGQASTHALAQNQSSNLEL